jgi:hypothetical protein
MGPGRKRLEISERLGAVVDPGDRRDYWLKESAGFAVEVDGRRLGLVEDVVYDSRIDRPDAVLVRVGLLRRRLALVPVDSVLALVPREQVVVVRGEAIEPPLASASVPRTGIRQGLFGRLASGHRQ